MKKKWINHSNDNKDLITSLSKELNISSTLAEILINRGIKDPQSGKRFLQPQLADMHDPFLMKGMDRAVSRIISAIKNEEKIFIYGDYDVDGVTSTSLLVTFFNEIGVDAKYYVPDRLTEGYGVKSEGLKNIKEDGGSLVITVDCGISSYKEVQDAAKMGIDVIITDHHHVPEVIPEAHAVLNPNQPDCAYPYKLLSGVGIAYKLVIGLRIGLRKEKEFVKILPNLMKHLDLVSLGSIADIIPFTEENRILIAYGLKEIANTEKIGLSALKKVSELKDNIVEVADVSFRLAPRINAAGRIADPKKGVRLLTTSDRKEAESIAANMNSTNKERQDMQETILTDVRNRIHQEIDLEKDRSIVLASPDWHSGIIGIVASKIIEEFYLPTILISLDDDKGRGSGRSIANFHICKGIAECSHLLGNFGGHKMAAGLFIKKENIADFKAAFDKTVKEQLTDDDFIPSLMIDTTVDLKDLTQSFVNDFNLLKPYGPSNPQPTFMSKGIKIKNCSLIGKNKDHIRFFATDNNVSLSVIGFGMGYLIDEIDQNNQGFDIAYIPQLNEWNGKTNVQLKLKDLRACC